MCKTGLVINLLLSCCVGYTQNSLAGGVNVLRVGSAGFLIKIKVALHWREIVQFAVSHCFPVLIFLRLNQHKNFLFFFFFFF